MSRTTITPVSPSGRQIVESYGGGGFKVGGIRHTGSILVFAEGSLAWNARTAADISAATLDPVLQRAPRPQILIVGCGHAFVERNHQLSAILREAGIGLEWMDTGAACRTFNVLLTEAREVAAALIAVD
jgi:uncharacterized protein